MALSNWIELAIMVAITIAGILLRRYLKRKLYRMDGFEGIITERGKPPRRNRQDFLEESAQLQQRINGK